MNNQDLMDLANLALEQCGFSPDSNGDEDKRWYRLSCELQALADHNLPELLTTIRLYVEQSVSDTSLMAKVKAEILDSLARLWYDMRAPQKEEEDEIDELIDELGWLSEPDTLV
jgi:hypothetical protein